MRKELEGEPDHEGTHVELDWHRNQGDTNGVDYAFDSVGIGFGLDGHVHEDAWIGLVGGLAWLHTEIDAEPEDLDGEDAWGPYIAVQGGWLVTTWLEPFARADASVYFPDLSTVVGFEAGLRFHLVEHTALFVGWRYARYDLVDLDSFSAVDKLELDASGFAAGLEFAF